MEKKVICFFLSIYKKVMKLFIHPHWGYVITSTLWRERALEGCYVW
jgi:hypothetical protein